MSQDQYNAPPAYPGLPGKDPSYPNHQEPHNQQQHHQIGFVASGNTSTVITAQPGTQVIMTVPLGHHSQRMTCPHCGADVMTSTTHESGLLTHLCALGLCLVQCWLGCCLIPYCVDDCKDTIHECPNCKRNVGVIKRL